MKTFVVLFPVQDSVLPKAEKCEAKNIDKAIAKYPDALWAEETTDVFVAYREYYYHLNPHRRPKNKMFRKA
jgi:hypothetical protein